MLRVKHQHNAWYVVETKTMLVGFRFPLLKGDTVMLLRKKTHNVAFLCLHSVMGCYVCYGLHHFPQNLYAEVLTPSNSECDSIWRQAL